GSPLPPPQREATAMLSFTARRTVLTLTLMLAAAPLGAQQGGAWQLRIPSGRMIATGDQRSVIKDAPVIAIQVARTISASTAITTTLGWARSRDLTHPQAPKLDILSGDIGLEQRVTMWRLGRGTSFTPFVGVGGGVRQLDSRLHGASAATAVAGYF